MKSKVAITKVTISLQKEKAQTDFICGRCDLFQQRHEGLMEDARARACVRVCLGLLELWEADVEQKGREAPWILSSWYHSCHFTPLWTQIDINEKYE